METLGSRLARGLLSTEDMAESDDDFAMFCDPVAMARGCARLQGMGDLTSDIGGDVSAISGGADAIKSGDAGAIIGAGVQIVGQGIKTYGDVSGSGSSGSGSSGSTQSTGNAALDMANFILAHVSNGDYTGPPLARLKGVTDPVKWAQQIQRRAGDLNKYASRAGMPVTAYVSIGGGAWQPVAGKWAKDGVHFVPNVPLPAGAHLVVTQSGAPPTVDPKTANFRVSSTPSPSGAQQAAPAPAPASKALPIVAAAAAAVFAASRLL